MKLRLLVRFWYHPIFMILLFFSIIYICKRLNNKKVGADLCVCPDEAYMGKRVGLLYIGQTHRFAPTYCLGVQKMG